MKKAPGDARGSPPYRRGHAGLCLTRVTGALLFRCRTIIGFRPRLPSHLTSANEPESNRPFLERAAGIEPGVGGLEGRCLTIRPSPQCGAPGGNRTPDRLVTNELLLPAELQGRKAATGVTRGHGGFDAPDQPVTRWVPRRLTARRPATVRGLIRGSHYLRQWVQSGGEPQRPIEWAIPRSRSCCFWPPSSSGDYSSFFDSSTRVNG